MRLYSLIPVIALTSAQSADGDKCNSTDGCINKSSRCCTWIRAADSTGSASNGLYCADATVTQTELGPIGAQSLMNRGNCHDTGVNRDIQNPNTISESAVTLKVGVSVASALAALY